MKPKQIQKIAKILSSLEKEKPEKKQEAIDYLVKELKSKGDLSVLPKILQELRRVSHRERAVLTFAREDIDKELQEKVKAKLKSELQDSDQVNIKIDPNIIGGFIAKTKNYLIDGSVRGVLKRVRDAS